MIDKSSYKGLINLALLYKCKISFYYGLNYNFININFKNVSLKNLDSLYSYIYRKDFIILKEHINYFNICIGKYVENDFKEKSFNHKFSKSSIKSVQKTISKALSWNNLNDDIYWLEG